jgi:NAD(P)-dependent dehydrogenase (short-subunit alcohol dehydrogenase family)
MMAATLEKFQDAIVSGIPLRRVGRPEDMAAICLFLASKGGSYVTGECIAVDGGALVAAHI